MLQTTAKRPHPVYPTGDESSSSRQFPFFPAELISEILLRLPVKSLLRFRCVCKSWKTLISGPQFAKDHLRTSIADPNMAHLRLVSSMIDDESKIISCSLHSLFQNPPAPPFPIISTLPQNFQILGSCNGLLCLFDTDHGYVGLWNPSTTCRSESFPIGLCRNSFLTYGGFGYDHVNDKYKVLVVVEDFDSVVTKIFTFGPNSWTTIQNFPYHPCKWLGKFVSGSLNWIAKGEDYQWVIISLDLGKETFGEVLLPEREGHEVCNPALDVMHDSLCFCYFELKKNQWIVWVMKEFGVHESWTIMMNLMIPGVERLGRWGNSVDSLCILENGVVLLKTSVADLVLYNSNIGRFIYPGTWSKVGLDLHIYHESLISPLY